eukprot:CAMPEP_0117669540 /NCGR_PEP_ID=MMETSP0804-20121206/12193_1 /TAXON_ID=1074897 /ORGANISM="Tetraselmis astigmatica, Strain CCMP880" /LENGTH=86 /DNA_ID=CAMNT_0005477617 /DNA_START=387 /DNA_END=647 /DNA_ORIENTATION=+
MDGLVHVQRHGLPPDEWPAGSCIDIEAASSGAPHHTSDYTGAIVQTKPHTCVPPLQISNHTNNLNRMDGTESQVEPGGATLLTLRA